MNRRARKRKNFKNIFRKIELRKIRKGFSSRHPAKYPRLPQWIPPIFSEALFKAIPTDLGLKLSGDPKIFAPKIISSNKKIIIAVKAMTDKKSVFL